MVRKSRGNAQPQDARGKLTLSERMARIRKTDTKPEMTVRRLVHGMGYRYRLHQSRLPGKPDIVLGRLRKVILVHGCFWHRHNCADGRKLPIARPEYWKPKLERNRQRDTTNITQLKELGWDVLVLWECEIAKGELVIEKVERFLNMRT